MNHETPDTPPPPTYRQAEERLMAARSALTKLELQEERSICPSPELRAALSAARGEEDDARRALARAALRGLNL
jgi:hypothetical protein